MAARGAQLIVAVSLIAAATAVARAADGDVATVVLGIEALDGQDNALATEMTDALRQRVASAKGFQLVQGKDLVEIKLVFSCSDEAPACMAQAGKSMGATRVIYGNVRRSGGDHVLTLKLLDVARATVDSTTIENVTKRRAEPAALRASSAQWLAKLTGKAANGNLLIRSNVSGAIVILDGVAVGLTGSQPMMVPDVAPGPHDVTLQKAGLTANQQSFTMGAGQALPLNVTMTPEAADAAPERAPETLAGSPSRDKGHDAPADDGAPSLARPGFWIAMVLTAASFGAATKFGLDVRRINSDLDQYRQVPCSKPPSGYCTPSGAAISDPQRSLDQKNTIAHKLDEGDTAHMLQWVFVGVGSAFAIAGGFLLYKGYLDQESGAGPRTSDNRGLRIFPTADASSGGVVAEFDF
jgi:hypothetical protein